MECHVTYATCVVTVPWPLRASPDCPASLPSFRAPSLGREAAGMAPLSLEGWCQSHILPNAVQQTHTLAHCSFCTLSFNQALSWASVTALSARRVKDLSPQVTSLTDPLTDRPLAHLVVDVTAVSAWSEKSV